MVAISLWNLIENIFFKSVKDLNWDMNILGLVIARTYLQLQLRQWGAGNVYLLVLSSWKVNIAKKPIAVMGL